MDSRLYHLRGLAERTYRELVKKAIAKIRAFPEECGMGETLPDAWEAYKYQVQEGESVVFNAYEASIELVCQALIDEVDPQMRVVLWLWSEAYLDWPEDEDEPSLPDQDTMDSDLATELYQRVRGAAEDEELTDSPSMPFSAGDADEDEDNAADDEEEPLSATEGTPSDAARPDCACRSEDVHTARTAITACKCIAEIIDDSHFRVAVLRCDCGQHFLYVFTEEIDWENGEDPQAWLRVPLSNAEAARAASYDPDTIEDFIMGLSSRRHLRSVFPSIGASSEQWINGPIVILPHD